MAPPDENPEIVTPEGSTLYFSENTMIKRYFPPNYSTKHAAVHLSLLSDSADSAGQACASTRNTKIWAIML